MALTELRAKLPHGDVGRIVNSFVFSGHPDATHYQRSYRESLVPLRIPHPLENVYEWEVFEGYRGLQRALEPLILRVARFDDHLENCPCRRAALYNEAKRLSWSKASHYRRLWAGGEQTEKFWRTEVNNLRTQWRARVFKQQKLLAFCRGDRRWLTELFDLGYDLGGPGDFV